MKNSTPQPRQSQIETIKPPPKSAEALPDINGAWQGVIECVDHGAVRRDNNIVMEFLPDSNWYVESSKSRYAGTWSAVIWEENLTIMLRVPDSPWMWNGPLSAKVHENELVLTLSRSWQFDCTMRLHRLQ